MHVLRHWQAAVWGFVESAIHTGFTFCHSNVIYPFFCDILPTLDLSHSDIYLNEIVLFILAAFNVCFALIVILTSYLFIFIAILRMRSAEGRKKAFSTCASHLTAVTIFYGTVMFMYLQPSSSHSMDNDQMASVFYTIIVPMLNPIVYSLRNKEVNNAFRKVTKKLKILFGPQINQRDYKSCIVNQLSIVVQQNITMPNATVLTVLWLMGQFLCCFHTGSFMRLYIFRTVSWAERFKMALFTFLTVDSGQSLHLFHMVFHPPEDGPDFSLSIFNVKVKLKDFLKSRLLSHTAFFSITNTSQWSQRAGPNASMKKDHIS